MYGNHKKLANAKLELKVLLKCLLLFVYCFAVTAHALMPFMYYYMMVAIECPFVINHHLISKFSVNSAPRL